MILQDSIKQKKPFRNNYHKTTVNLLFTGRWILSLHNDLFKNYGLTMQQYNVLKILNGQYPRPSTILLIRDRMIDDMSDTSRVVEGLRKKGLLERNQNAYNRRKVDVLITQKGIDLLNLIENNDADTMDDFLSNLSETEVENLNTLLDKARKDPTL